MPGSRLGANGPWDAGRRRVIDRALAAADRGGAPSIWVLSNHDVVRPVTRYARSQPDYLVDSPWDRERWADNCPSSVTPWTPNQEKRSHRPLRRSRVCSRNLVPSRGSVTLPT